MKFIEAINNSTTLLADGATGTMLQFAGLPVGDAPELWTLKKPDAIRDLARAYAEAGSEIVYTNTFGANRVRAQRFEMDDKIGELNKHAVELARKGISAAHARAFVVGAIGPTGEMLEPYGELSAQQAREAFAEQAAALSAAGVDGIVCESFADLQEALLCVEAARSVAKVPVLASMTFEPNGRTMMGATPEEAAIQLAKAGAAAVGANCSIGPEVVENAIRAMKAAQPRARLLAKPNAGMPQFAGDKATYPVTREALAEFAKRMKSLGVAIVGGCCGTTPEHIRAMRKVL